MIFCLEDTILCYTFTETIIHFWRDLLYKQSDTPIKIAPLQYFLLRIPRFFLQIFEKKKHIRYP